MQPEVELERQSLLELACKVVMAAWSLRAGLSVPSFPEAPATQASRYRYKRGPQPSLALLSLLHYLQLLISGHPETGLEFL